MYELSSMTFGQTSNTSVTNFTANIVAGYSHLKSILLHIWIIYYYPFINKYVVDTFFS